MVQSLGLEHNVHCCSFCFSDKDNDEKNVSTVKCVFYLFFKNFTLFIIIVLIFYRQKNKTKCMFFIPTVSTPASDNQTLKPFLNILMDSPPLIYSTKTLMIFSQLKLDVD